MSIYKKEASLEEMKREAIRRMGLLKLDARTIRDFERDGSVSLSQQICGVGDGGWCQRDHGAAPGRRSDPAGVRNLPDEEAVR